MIIYVDLIIIINMIIDFVLLMAVSLLLKRKVKIFKIVLGSFAGSLSTILLFYIDSNTLLLIYKLFISVLMVIITFKYQSFSYFKDNLVWLYILSIILGGSFYLIDNQWTMVNDNYIFSSNGLKINLIILIILTPAILYKYLKSQQKFKTTYSNYYDISIYYDDIVLNGTGFLDTGNNLKDPYFNRPIILVNKNLIKHKVKTFLVPYHTVNNEGLLEVFKPKKIVVNNKGIRNALIGLSDVNIDGVKIILNKEAI